MSETQSNTQATAAALTAQSATPASVSSPSSDVRPAASSSPSRAPRPKRPVKAADSAGENESQTQNNAQSTHPQQQPQPQPISRLSPSSPLSGPRSSRKKAPSSGPRPSGSSSPPAAPAPMAATPGQTGGAPPMPVGFQPHQLSTPGLPFPYPGSPLSVPLSPQAQSIFLQQQAQAQAQAQAAMGPQFFNPASPQQYQQQMQYLMGQPSPQQALNYQQFLFAQMMAQQQRQFQQFQQSFYKNGSPTGAAAPSGPNAFAPSPAFLHSPSPSGPPFRASGPPSPATAKPADAAAVDAIAQQMQAASITPAAPNQFSPYPVPVSPSLAPKPSPSYFTLAPVPAASLPNAPKVPFYSIDVECVASGPTHNDRVIAHIALVDQDERVLLNLYVKPKVPVFSYLSALTGLSEEIINRYGIDLDDAIKQITDTLPNNCMLVGQNILKDVQWLKLEEGAHYGSMMDLGGIWRVFHPKYKNYSYFSLHHEAKSLLGIDQGSTHHAATDAIISIKLYKLYLQLSDDQAQMARAHELLLNSPPEASFAKKNPVFDGVCQGVRKECKCGGPFFY